MKDLKIFFNKKNKKIFPLLTAILSITLFFVLGDIEIQNKISNYFNFSIGLLTMGRSTYFTYLYDGIDFNLLNIIFGYGVGYPQEILASYLGKKFLLHNDWLKLFFEGGLVTVLFICYIIRNLSITSIFLLSIWMLTDNVFVYFPVIIIICWFENKRKSFLL